MRRKNEDLRQLLRECRILLLGVSEGVEAPRGLLQANSIWYEADKSQPFLVLELSEILVDMEPEDAINKDTVRPAVYLEAVFL